MKKTNRCLIGFAVMAFIISCKPSKIVTSTTSPPIPPPVAVTLTYNSSVKNILDENCNGCHRDVYKGDFTNYVGVKSKVDNGSFNERIFVAKDMPPKEPLSSGDLAILKQWLEAGAPQ